jgi:hypothetical protein
MSSSPWALARVSTGADARLWRVLAIAATR